MIGNIVANKLLYAWKATNSQGSRRRYEWRTISSGDMIKAKPNRVINAVRVLLCGKTVDMAYIILSKRSRVVFPIVIPSVFHHSHRNDTDEDQEENEMHDPYWNKDAGPPGCFAIHVGRMRYD